MLEPNPCDDGTQDAPVLTGDPWAIDARPSLMIVAPDDTAPEIRAMATGAGFRVTASIGQDAMAARLARTVGVDAMLLDLRGLAPHDGRLVPLLTALLAWPAWTDAKPLLLVDMATAEAVAALLHLRLDRLLCDPALSDIALGLCLLARDGVTTARLHDIGRDSDAARLEELSAEVRRLARTIDRLARNDDTGVEQLHDRELGYQQPAPPDTRTDRAKRGGDRGASRATHGEVRALLQARRLRDRFMPGDLFADPAWDMMLDLMNARLDGKTVSVSSLCIAAAVPPTTALRWISQLTERGIFERRNDPNDARRVFISLSDAAAENLGGWFGAVRQMGLRFTA